MATIYLHEHKDFHGLLLILERETGIAAGLVEKDYWIMHCLYGLKAAGLEFELKGGTSLSKGFGIIERFSEDIDIHIKPPAAMGINENPKNYKAANAAKRKDFYDNLAKTLAIDGIISVERDTAFDEAEYYRSGGIRLHYDSKTEKVEGVKEGILLEAGFDRVTPNSALTISSWAYDRAAATKGISIIDNRAKDIACYHAGYTFVEKLQTIATKFRQEQADGIPKVNLMRQYYDVYCLLEHPEVLEFIGTEAYHAHKAERFPKPDLTIPVAENEAFLLSDKTTRSTFAARYAATSGLYYNGQPEFDVLLERLSQYLPRL
jgi:hypothetical protein